MFMPKGKIKLQIEAEGVEFPNIEINQKTIKIETKNLASASLLRKYLENDRKNIYIENDNQKISAINYKYSEKYCDDGEVFIISPQFFYIGSEYVLNDVSDINKLTIYFESDIVYANELHKKIFPSHKRIKYKEFSVTLNCNLLEVTSTKAFAKSDLKNEFHNFIEILWLMYGFVPKIKKIELQGESKNITEYVDLIYLYNSSSFFINEYFKLIDIDRINNWEQVMKKYEEFKSKYKIFIQGLLLSCMDTNRYADIRVCNLLQSIDGFSENIFDGVSDENSKRKATYIDSIIDFIEDSEENEYSKSIIDSLNNFKKESFKERLKRFIDLDCYNIFIEEEKLKRIYENKQNKCNYFLKINKLLELSVNERNRLSHMVDDNRELFDEDIRMYYFLKYLFLCREIIADKVGIKYAIDNSRFKKNLLHWHNYFIKKDKCSVCKLYKENKCDLLKEDIDNE